MKLDLDILLQGFGDDEPSGPDLEYDAEFAELQIAGQAKPEQQVGDKIIEAEEADHSEVVKVGVSLLEKSMDLRVAVFLAESALNREGFPAFAQVIEYINRTLDEYWDTVHPQLDAEDDDDPTERVNALIGLVDGDRMLRQVKRTPFTDSKVMGRFTLRHLAVAKEGMVAPSDLDSTPNMVEISAACQDTPEENMQAIRDGLENSVRMVAEIEAKLDDKVATVAPDFSPLGNLLKAALNAVKEGLGEEVGAVEDAADVPEDNAASGGGAPSGGGRGVGAISTSADVSKTIDLILDYYNRNEQSSPVPVLLARAKRLVGADFLTIIKDMAATGEDEVRQIGGIPADDGY